MRTPVSQLLSHLVCSASVALTLASCSESSAPAQAADVAGDTVGAPDAADPVDAEAEDAEAEDTTESDPDVAGAPDTSEDTEPPPPVGYASDDTLRVNHIQCTGTHNSYHVAPPIEQRVPDWAYTHPPIAEQLAAQGARHFELDVYEEDGKFRVTHIPFLDEVTTCATLALCLEEIAGWSAENPGHHPLFVMIELKHSIDIEDWLAPFEATIDDTLGALPDGRRRVVTPDEVRGDAVDLRTAVTTTGWPTLRETRGRVFVMVMKDDGFRDAWLAAHPKGSGSPVFVHADPTDSHAAFVKIDDPKDQPALDDAAAAGFVIRTRADSVPGTPGDDGLHDSVAALASGAHMVSSDHLTPRGGKPYQFAIPDGTPSRCNPVAAPETCTSLALEDPALLRGYRYEAQQ